MHAHSVEKCNRRQLYARTCTYLLAFFTQALVRRIHLESYPGTTGTVLRAFFISTVPLLLLPAPTITFTVCTHSLLLAQGKSPSSNKMKRPSKCRTLCCRACCFRYYYHHEPFLQPLATKSTAPTTAAALCYRKSNDVFVRRGQVCAEERHRSLPRAYHPCWKMLRCPPFPSRGSLKNTLSLSA